MAMELCCHLGLSITPKLHCLESHLVYLLRKQMQENEPIRRNFGKIQDALVAQRTHDLCKMANVVNGWGKIPVEKADAQEWAYQTEFWKDSRCIGGTEDSWSTQGGKCGKWPRQKNMIQGFSIRSGRCTTRQETFGELRNERLRLKLTEKRRSNDGEQQDLRRLISWQVKTDISSLVISTYRPLFGNPKIERTNSKKQKRRRTHCRFSLYFETGSLNRKCYDRLCSSFSPFANLCASS